MPAKDFVFFIASFYRPVSSNLTVPAREGAAVAARTAALKGHASSIGELEAAECWCNRIVRWRTSCD